MKKAVLHKEYLQKRMLLTEKEAGDKNSQVRDRLDAFLQKKSFEVVHTFLPQRGKNEIDTWQIISDLRKIFAGSRIVVPCVIPGTRQMDHYILNAQTALTENRWGIPEPDPATSIRVEPQAIDVVLIPLLAFDQAGFRVGYGGGFYDRFLAQCNPETIKIGLSFFEPVEMIDDIDRFDVKMDACITPEGIYNWQRNV